MYREQLLDRLKSLRLPKDGYCVFGGACLAIRDIRATDDIDLYVTTRLYDELKRRGWQEKTDPWPSPYLVTNINGTVVEVYKAFENKKWQPKFDRYLTKPEIIAGYRFMPLDELYEWKAVTRRPKDIRDIKLIEHYRAQGSRRG